MEHAVNGSIDVHSLVITQFGSLETFLKLCIFLRIDLCKIRLIDVELLIYTEDGRRCECITLLLGHHVNVAAVNLLAVLVFVKHVPKDDRHGLRTLVDAKSHVLCLQESHIERHLVAVYGGVELEEEGVATIQGSAGDVLRKAVASCSVNPTLLPMALLHFLHPGYHHVGKLLDSKLRLRLAVAMLMIILSVLHT